MEKEVNSAPIDDSVRAEGALAEEETKIFEAGKALPDVDEAVQEKMWKGIERWLEEFSLSPIAKEGAKNWIKKMALPENQESMARVRQYVIHRIQGRKRSPPPTPWHNPCPEILPGLSANPFWDTDSARMEWTKEFEASYDKVYDELMALRGQAGFQPYRGPSWTQGLEAEDGMGKVESKHLPTLSEAHWPLGSRVLFSDVGRKAMMLATGTSFTSFYMMQNSRRTASVALKL